MTPNLVFLVITQKNVTWILNVWVYAHVNAGTLRAKEWQSGLLELKVPAVMSVVLGTKPMSSPRV